MIYKYIRQSLYSKSAKQATLDLTIIVKQQLSDKYLYAILIISSAVFVGMFLRQVGTDIYAFDGYKLTHVGFFAERNYTIYMKSPPGLYLLLGILSGFSRNISVLNIAALVLLVMAVVAKYSVTVRHIEKSLRGDMELRGRASQLATMMILVMPIITTLGTTYIYAGKIPPNVWHNPTTILCMPLIVVFYSMIISCKDGVACSGWKFLLVITSIALIKPSILFSFIAVAPWYIFGSKANMEFRRFMAIGFVACVVLVIAEAVLFYSTSMAILAPDSRSSLAIAPFREWYSLLGGRSIAVALISSIAYPVFVFVSLRKYYKWGRTSFVISMYVSSLVVFIIFAESGYRADNGNFIWGAIMATYMMFVEASVLLCRHYKEIPSRLSTVAISLLLMHVVSGIVYSVRLTFYGGYM